MNGAGLLVAALENEGVKQIFGVPGEENLDVVEALRRSTIRLVVTRHEQAAAFMAATHGRLTGEAGVCLSTLGPGALNLTTGAAYALLGAMPMIMITGQKGILSRKQARFQVVDIVSTMTPLTKMARQIVSPASIPALVREAFRLAQQERPGPVHLELPEDIAHEDWEDIPLIPPHPIEYPVAHPAALDRAAELIRKAERPLVMLGAAASRPRLSDALSAFVGRLQIPFFNTQMGKGSVSRRRRALYGHRRAVRARLYDCHREITRCPAVCSGHNDPFRTDCAIRNAGRSGRSARAGSSRSTRSGVRKPAMNEEIKHAPRETAESQALVSGTSAKEASDLLFQLLVEVVGEHQPELEPVLKGGANIYNFTPELMARALQAQGIWFQLLSIAEQNAAMRRRRQIERMRGRAGLRGSFDHVLAERRAEGVPPRIIEALLSSLRIRPVITAHPTKSKRVTVLEKYRRIYLLLRELEMPRWTERERAELIGDLRDQIELVWMTGELHLQKPTVEHEVSRGLHFFDESLFEKAPEMLALLDGALQHYYPGTRFELAPFFQFGSWIGGDRDGNPSVTTRVTGWTLKQNALASLRHYRDKLLELAKSLSITERALPVPESFREELTRSLDASEDGETIRMRNPGEPYRQFLTLVLRKVDATLARIQGMDIAGPGSPYANADELIHDLRVVENALSEARSPSIAVDIVKPVRRAVEIFRFSTVRLDLRENTDAHDGGFAIAVVDDRRPRRCDPPELGSREWRAWLLRELSRPLTALRLVPELSPRPPISLPCFARPERSGAMSTATRSARSSCR